MNFQRIGAFFTLDCLHELRPPPKSRGALLTRATPVACTIKRYRSALHTLGTVHNNRQQQAPRAPSRRRSARIPHRLRRPEARERLAHERLLVGAGQLRGRQVVPAQRRP